MNGYIAFFNGKQIEVFADSSYQAQQIAIVKFSAPKSKKHMVAVILAEKDGAQVTHSAASV